MRKKYTCRDKIENMYVTKIAMYWFDMKLEVHFNTENAIFLFVRTFLKLTEHSYNEQNIPHLISYTPLIAAHIRMSKNVVK